MSEMSISVFSKCLLVMPISVIVEIILRKSQ